MSVIIAGGGMAGASLALALSRLSHGQMRVHLIEASRPHSQRHPGFDARAIALAQGTCAQLARIGVWQAIADVACPIRQVFVSQQGHAGTVTLNASDYQLDALGQVVELHEVGQRLFRLLAHAPGVTLHCPARVSQVSRTVEQVSVQLDNGDRVQGQLLVAADGSYSPIARQCGIQWQQSDYQQQAVIANITTEQAHDYRAFERFTVHGPLALLPMSANRCSLVWCHALQPSDQPDDQQSDQQRDPQSDQQQQVMAWSDARFCDELQRAFGWQLGRITHVGARSSYPLILSRASRTVTHRLVLVGNAAQTLHPVAGQGFNLGLRDVISLAETLTESASALQDSGSYPLLAAYQRRRQADTDATISITDGLIHLFANRWQPLVCGRSTGLIAMSLLSPLRDKLAHRALGWVAR